jgi:hypothetical protein
MGPAGGVSGYEVVEVSRSANGPASLIVACPAGKVVLGGGASVSSNSVNIYVNRPMSDHAHWYVRAQGAVSYTLNVYAICAVSAE